MKKKIIFLAIALISAGQLIPLAAETEEEAKRRRRDEARDARLQRQKEKREAAKERQAERKEKSLSNAEVVDKRLAKLEKEMDSARDMIWNLRTQVGELQKRVATLEEGSANKASDP